MRGVDERDAGDGAVEPDLVDDAGDVDLDRQVRHGLRQQEQQEDRPRQGSFSRPSANPAGIAMARLTTVSTAIQTLVPSEASALPRGEMRPRP